jgi:hypothetical protein
MRRCTRVPASSDEQVAALEARAMSVLPALIRGGRVAAVGLQGGLGRRRVDERSDVDFVLAFRSEDDVEDALRGELTLDGVKVSAFHVVLDRVDPRRWSDKQRYVYAYETRPVHDREGRLAALCAAAALSRAEQEDRVFHHVKKLGNRGVTYGGRLGFEWLEVRWDDSPRLWVERGDLLSAHLRLNQALDLLVGLLFSINRQPVPSPKWRYHLVMELPWTPPDCAARLSALANADVGSEGDFERRLGVAVALLTEAVDRACANGLLRPGSGRRYWSQFSRHRDDTE